jgi:hypothetical protein
MRSFFLAIIGLVTYAMANRSRLGKKAKEQGIGTFIAGGAVASVAKKALQGSAKL